MSVQLWVDGAHQPGKAAHLGEGNPDFKSRVGGAR